MNGFIVCISFAPFLSNAIHNNSQTQVSFHLAWMSRKNAFDYACVSWLAITNSSTEKTNTKTAYTIPLLYHFYPIFWMFRYVLYLYRCRRATMQETLQLATWWEGKKRTTTICLQLKTNRKWKHSYKLLHAGNHKLNKISQTTQVIKWKSPRIGDRAEEIRRCATPHTNKCSG